MSALVWLNDRFTVAKIECAPASTKLPWTLSLSHSNGWTGRLQYKTDEVVQFKEGQELQLQIVENFPMQQIEQQPQDYQSLLYLFNGICVPLVESEQCTPTMYNVAFTFGGLICHLQFPNPADKQEQSTAKAIYELQQNVKSNAPISLLIFG